MWWHSTRRHRLAVALILLLSLNVIANCYIIEQKTVQIKNRLDADPVPIPPQHKSANWTIPERYDFPNQIPIPIYDFAIEENNRDSSQEMPMKDVNFPREVEDQIDHDSDVIAAGIEALLTYITDQADANRELNRAIALLNFDYGSILSQESLMWVAIGGNDSKSNQSKHQRAKDIGRLNRTIIVITGVP